MKCSKVLCSVAIIWLVSIGGCGDSSTSKPPVFSLAWSEYPSWSVFGVAHEKKLIDGAQGKLGPIEKKWGVDIVLKETDYDTSMTMYASAACDAVCITNMDALAPSLTRDSVAILPTSTSYGADALIVTGIDNVQELRNHKVYGLAKSVSEYCFVRNLELKGEKESDHQFTNMDPGAAALAMITKQAGYEAIVVWNPFVLETLKKRDDAKVLFDSTSIPGEIVDMVVVAKTTLEADGGEAFAHAVVDTYYQVNKMLADPATGDQTLVALGAKFSSLGLEEMKEVVKQTLFYKTPAEALELFEGDQFRSTMATVVQFCASHGVIDKQPQLSFSPGAATGAQLTFATKYIKHVGEKAE